MQPVQATDPSRPVSAIVNLPAVVPRRLAARWKITDKNVHVIVSIFGGFIFLALVAGIWKFARTRRAMKEAREAERKRAAANYARVHAGAPYRPAYVPRKIDGDMSVYAALK